MLTAVYRKKFRMLSGGTEPGHTAYSSFMFSLSFSCSELKNFSQSIKRNAGINVARICGQILIGSFEWIQTSDFFLFSLSIVSGPSTCLSQGKALMKSVWRRLSEARPRDVLHSKNYANFEGCSWALLSSLCKSRNSRTLPLCYSSPFLWPCFANTFGLTSVTMWSMHDKRVDCTIPYVMPTRQTLFLYPLAYIASWCCVPAHHSTD